ncbi:MAG: diacylglycerol kinase family protein [Candidatus Paceibacterota bacterium]
MENNSDTKKSFSIKGRKESFVNAGRGIWVFLKRTHNAWIQIASSVVVVFLGFYFEITNLEWVLLVFAIGLVFVAEAFNTAIEIDIDLTSPEYHPYAKDTKDVAAGAVLISACIAFIVGLLIFGHYLF